MKPVEPSKQCATSEGSVNPDHPMLAGHFPGHPIVPGAWLLTWVIGEATHKLRLAGEGRAIVGVKRVKFQRPLAPSEEFNCELSTSSDAVRFTLSSAAGVIATGILQLTTQGDS